MDHSLQGYLGRQTTDALLVLLQSYQEKEDDFSQGIAQMILGVLAQRGVTLDQ